MKVVVVVVMILVVTEAIRMSKDVIIVDTEHEQRIVGNYMGNLLGLLM